MKSNSIVVKFQKMEQNLKQKVLFLLGKEKNLQNYLIGEDEKEVIAYLEFTENIPQGHFDHIAPNSVQYLEEKDKASYVLQILAEDPQPFSNFDHGSIISALEQNDLFSLMEKNNLPYVSIWKTSFLKDGKTKSDITVSFTDQQGKQHSIQQHSQDNISSDLKDLYRSFKELRDFSRFNRRRNLEKYFDNLLDFHPLMIGNI